MDELVLVRASQQGDKAAFGSLIDSHYKDVYKLAYSYIGCHEEADDICQETFLRAFNRIKELRDAHRFQGWIFMIALNLLRKRIKEIRRGKRLVTKKVGGIASELAESKRSEPFETLSAKEKTIIIHKQLQEMPEHMRLATILILMEGLTQKDAAWILNCSESSVSRHLDAAKKWLRARLKRLI